MSRPVDVRGYVRIYRRMLENPLFTSKPAEWFKLWMFILQRVNWRPSTFRPRVGEPVEIPAGSMVTSLEKLAHTTDTTKEQARKCLDYLERTHMVTLHKTHHWTKITVLNWATYQQLGDAPEHTGEHAGEHSDFENGSLDGTHKRTHTGTPSKEVKNNSTTLSKFGDWDSVQVAASGKRKLRPVTAGINSEVRQWFEDEFWPRYPRHEAKGKALEAAGKKATTPEKRAFYIERLKAQLPEYSRRKGDSGQRVIPLGATWFNQDRAEDELPLQEPAIRRGQQAVAENDYPEYRPLESSNRTNGPAGRP